MHFFTVLELFYIASTLHYFQYNREIPIRYKMFAKII